MTFSSARWLESVDATVCNDGTPDAVRAPRRGLSSKLSRERRVLSEVLRCLRREIVSSMSSTGAEATVVEP